MKYSKKNSPNGTPLLAYTAWYVGLNDLNSIFSNWVHLKLRSRYVIKKRLCSGLWLQLRPPSGHPAVCKHGDDLQTLICKSLTRPQEKQIKYSGKSLPAKFYQRYMSARRWRTFTVLFETEDLTGSNWSRDDHMMFFGTSRPVIRVTWEKTRLSHYGVKILKYNVGYGVRKRMWTPERCGWDWPRAWTHPPDSQKLRVHAAVCWWRRSAYVWSGLTESPRLNL